MFSIELEDNKRKDADGSEFFRGHITLGDFGESFRAPCSYWSAADYRAHWRVGVQRLLAGESRSCLITSALDPKSANFIVTWPLWRVKADVFVRQQIVFLDKLQKPLDLADPYWIVGERRMAKGADQPSEWRVTVIDLKAFLERESN